MNFREKLKKRAEDIGVFLDEKQLGQFEQFYHLLLEKNKVMNLTSITEEDEVIEKHFVDSLTCGRVMDMQSVHRMIDVGTGAGFPGIPIKISYPHIEVILLDSLNKRVKFLDEVRKQLQMRYGAAISHISGRPMALSI